MLPEIHVPNYTPEAHELLELSTFKKLDYRAEECDIPVRLMMEQAGFQTARLAASYVKPSQKILIGAGPGNNGGGGLVAARRLKAWGYEVSLHLPRAGGNELFNEHLFRCRKQGISYRPDWEAEVFVDAYLGFSQRQPLEHDYELAVSRMNESPAIVVALDIPTGYADKGVSLKPDCIVCLAAPKKILLPYLQSIPVYIADLGIPGSIYREFGFNRTIPFYVEGLVKWTP